MNFCAHLALCDTLSRICRVHSFRNPKTLYWCVRCFFVNLSQLDYNCLQYRKTDLHAISYSHVNIRVFLYLFWIKVRIVHEYALIHSIYKPWQILECTNLLLSKKNQKETANNDLMANFVQILNLEQVFKLFGSKSCWLAPKLRIFLVNNSFDIEVLLSMFCQN